MAVSTDKLQSLAGIEAHRRGFRSVGIYHVLWAVWELDPEIFTSWLAPFQVDRDIFLKMLESVLRPRRAGGGLPRDRLDSELREEAIQLATALAAQAGVPPDSTHLGMVLGKLPENPIESLCERFCLAHRKP